MSQPGAPHRVRLLAALDAVVEWLGLAGGVTLALIVAIMVLDVLFRYVLLRPIAGAQDLVQLGLAVVIFLSLPYCGRSGGHVAVDVFERFMSSGVKRVADALIRVLGAAVYAALAWRVWQSGNDAGTFGEASNLLGVPLRPVYYLIAAGAALYALILAVELFAGPRRPAGESA